MNCKRAKAGSNVPAPPPAAEAAFFDGLAGDLVHELIADVSVQRHSASLRCIPRYNTSAEHEC